MTYGELLQAGVQKLTETGCTNVATEAAWLLSHVTGLCRTKLILQRSECVNEETARRFYQLIARRRAGEPLQYITGETEFFGITIQTGPGVFIPRPETEVLVEQVLRYYPGHGNVCDVCTGSGAVALALAFHLPRWIQVYATDSSEDALAYARLNKERHGADNLLLFEGSLFEPLPEEALFSVATANPPYVASTAYSNLDREIRDFEPSTALLSDNGGVGVIQRIAGAAYERLLPGGWLLCEISPEQARVVEELLHTAGYKCIKVIEDYTGKKRIALGQR